MKNFMSKFNGAITNKKTDLSEFSKGIKNLEKIVNISRLNELLSDSLKSNFNNSFLYKERYFGLGVIKENKFFIKSANLKEEKVKEIFPLNSLRLFKEEEEKYYKFKIGLPFVDGKSFDIFEILIPNIRDNESDPRYRYSTRSTTLEKGTLTKTWEMDLSELTNFLGANSDQSVKFMNELKDSLKIINKNSFDERLQIILSKHNPTLERIYNILKEVNETNFVLNSENINGICEILSNLQSACLDRIKTIESEQIEKQEKEKNLLLEAQESKQKRIEKILDFERELQTKYLI